MAERDPGMHDEPATGAAAGGADLPQPALLIEEILAAILLGGMVLLMFAQALVRNLPVLARAEFGTWVAHAVEILPCGLTWLTFLACAAVTRRRELLRVELLRGRLPVRWRMKLDNVVWALWGAFFFVLFVLGLRATLAQRHQMTSLEWLPGWVVALSVPLGAALVVWRTVQNIRDGYRSSGVPDQ